MYTLSLRRDAAVAGALVVLATVVYAQVVGFGFLQFDDNRMVYENEHVTRGITWPGIVWAWTQPHFGIWMPLTSMSHMLDVSFYGDWAGGHHLTNLLLHLANVVLAYFAFAALTGSPRRAAWVAALFAVHPFGASVVGWVSSRKELTWTLFFLVALSTYARYARKPSVARYLPVFLAMALGILCKPMIMTLPCVLLLLDWWPLGRWRGLGGAAENTDEHGRTRIIYLLAEKLPLLLLSGVAAAAALWGQEDVHAITLYGDVPAGVKIANATVSYARYLFHAVWPVWLSGHYPHLGDALTGTLVASAAVLLIAISAAVLLFVRRAPYLPVGWLWFLGTLFPVIGVVQYANASMADRYAYVPVIGLCLMAAWGVPALTGKRSQPKAAPQGKRAARGKGRNVRHEQAVHPVLAVFAIGSVLVFAVAGWWQTGFWRDTERLFTRALAVTKDNAMAHTNLGMVRLTQGRCAESIEHYREAARIESRNFIWQYNLGSALLVCNRPAEAVVALRLAIEGNATHAPSLMNLGGALLDLRRPQEALRYLAEAVRLDPNHVNSRINHARALLQTGQRDAAIAELEAALRLDPNNVIAREDLARLRGR